MLHNLWSWYNAKDVICPNLGHLKWCYKYMTASLPSRCHSRGGVKLSCRSYILPVCATCLWLSGQPQQNEMSLIPGRGIGWTISRTSPELQEWYQTIKHELWSILQWRPGNWRAANHCWKKGTGFDQEIDKTSVGVRNHTSQTKEDRRKDCTDANGGLKKQREGETSSGLSVK